MTGPIVAIRPLAGGKWHAPNHQPTGYGIWSMCGIGWPNDNYFASRTERVDCKRCLRMQQVAS